MQIIDTQKKLETNIQLMLSEKVIGVDTEFVRKKTYWPKLSLIQLVSESVELIIDIQAGLDLTTLWEVFRNKDILKVFHSCKQDIEAIYYLSDVIPISIYDTQIGAMFCGYNEPISYAKIVEDFLGMIKENPELKSENLKEDEKTKLMCLSGVKQYPMRVKCATLSWHTLVSAFDNKTDEVKTEN